MHTTPASSLPRPELATTASAWVRLIVQGIRRAGLDAEPLLNAAGIDPQQLEEPQARLAQQQITLLWQAASQHYAGDDLALVVGRDFQPQQAPVISYALRSSATVRQAAERLLRFHKLIGEALNLRMSEQDGGLLIRVEPGQPVPELSIQTALVAMAGMIRWLLPDTHTGLQASMRRAAPRKPTDWQQWFGQPVQFSARADSLFLPATVLAQSIPVRLPDAQQHDRAARQALLQLREQKALAHIRYWLEQALQLGEPDREWVAGCLGISVSTLQRRLRAHGETFSALLESTRRDVALRLLTQGVALNDIALRLGYQEQSTFQRAFRHWFGTTPGRWRRDVTRLSD